MNRWWSSLKEDDSDQNRNIQKILEMVFDLVTSFTKILSSCEEAENMKTMEFYIMLYIGMKGSKKMSELAEIFSTTKSNVTLLVNGLEKKRYIRRKRSKKDRRVVEICLTAKGEKIYSKTLESFVQLIKHIVKLIPTDDLQIISEGFFKMVQIFSNAKNENPEEYRLK